VNIRSVLMVLCLLAAPSIVLAAQTEVTGFGFIKDGDIAKARQAAIDDAKRLAVEQLLGSYISARTETKNFMLASEKIYATTKGRLDRFEILSEKQEEQTYQVSILAHTDSKQAATETYSLLQKNKWTKKPRIKIYTSLTSTNNVSSQAASAVNANIAKELSKEGFVVLSESSNLGASFHLKLNVSADTTQSEFQGMSINTNQLSVAGSLVNGASQDHIASVSFADKKAGDAAQSITNMAQKLSKRVVLKISMETKFAWLSSLENPVLIEVTAATPEQIEAIETDLQHAVIGLSGLSTENKTQQSTLLSASYVGWPEQLFDQLNQLSKRPDIRFNVQSFDYSKLVLSVK